MKKITLLISFFLLSLSFGFSQTIESADIPKLKNNEMFWIGESNGNSIFYAIEIHKDIVKLTFNKYKSTSLELVESKAIVLDDFERKVFDNNKGSCRVEVLYRNNKYYIFYSLIYSGDYHVYVRTLDENFANEKKLELGIIVETGYELLGNYYLTYSPDYKNALVVLKNFCERKKAVGTNTEIYENTELVNFDLINDKVVFSKKLPIEIEGLRLKSEQYKLDNDGNIACVTALAERKDGRSTIRSMAIGYVEKSKEQLTAMNIDLKGISSLTSNFYQLKNGDLLYTIVSGKDLKVKYICPKDQNKNFEKTIASSYFKGIGGFAVLDILEHSNGFYFTICESRQSWYMPIVTNYGAVSISRSGEFNWFKSFDLVKPIFYNGMESFKVSSAIYNNKLNVFYIENKPYEMTDKIKKQLDENITNAVYEFKQFNTVHMTVDESGRLEKKIINNNETFVLNPLSLNNLPETDHFYFNMIFKKSFKIKKVTFN